jgi:hypothetical protein
MVAGKLEIKAGLVQEDRIIRAERYADGSIYFEYIVNGVAIDQFAPGDRKLAEIEDFFIKAGIDRRNRINRESLERR